MLHNNHQKAVVVLMVPFPLQGHLNQLLHLSRLISARGLAVHFVGNAAHNLQARRRAHGWDPESISDSINNNNNNIHFHELPSLTYDPHQDLGINSHHHQMVINSKFQLSHIEPMFEAVPGLREPLREIINSLCRASRRVVIIHDSLMGSVVQDFVDFSNAEAYTFHSVSAYTMFFFFWENMGRPFELDEQILENLPSIEGCFSPDFARYISRQHEYMKLSSGRIYNTCKVVEGAFLDLLARPEISGNKRQWALGPFNPVSVLSDSRRHECLKWLDKQDGINSVILVSFGTTTTLSEQQIKELAIGLERSQQKFIWVLRNADKISYEDDDDDDDEVMSSRRLLLPQGFEERVKERGMVIVSDWAPQLEILGHSCIGGFMSHCGWNSCMESISMGVPIAAWPMHSDQPRNAVLIAKVLNIGILVRAWENRNDLVKSCVVECVVRKLMASEEGAEMRRRAAELGARVREEEGGATSLELESFVAHITRHN